MTEKVTTRKARTAVRGRPLYYLLIDATDTQDSAAFGGLIEKHRGWVNLLDDKVLQRAPEDPNRLVDSAHPYLPIHLVQAPGSSKRVAVVCPSGATKHTPKGSMFGVDPFWRALEDGTGEPMRDLDGSLVSSREEAVLASERLLEGLILSPSVQRATLAGYPYFHLRDDRSSDQMHRSADLLYLSSHGWLGGFMRGNGASFWDRPNIQIEPGPFFSIGLAASKGLGFQGPRWIVLAQCSTLTQAIWPLWNLVLARSSPPVHGILAYGEASPGPGRSVEVARKFFAGLSQGRSFLEAWKSANEGLAWSAIVHEKIKDEGLMSLRTTQLSQQDIAPSTASPGFSGYRGYSPTLPAGNQIREPKPSFSVRVESLGQYGGEVNASTLHTVRAGFWTGRRFRFTLQAPKGEGVVRATLELVHIRPSYPKQVSWSQAFSAIDCEGAVGVVGVASRVLALTPKSSPQATLTFEATARSSLDPSLEPNHSYLWLRVGMTTTKRMLRGDFVGKGLLVYKSL